MRETEADKMTDLETYKQMEDKDRQKTKTVTHRSIAGKIQVQSLTAAVVVEILETLKWKYLTLFVVIAVVVKTFY